MKPHHQLLGSGVTGTIACVLVFTLVRAALLNAADASRNKTNSVAVAAVTKEADIPKAVFEDNAGYDPFFPRSSRNRPVAVGTTNKNVVPKSLFVLNSLIPRGNRPTAQVNGRPFEKGEEGDVRLPDGTKVRVRCLEIREESVLIEAGDPPQRIELRLRFGL